MRYWAYIGGMMLGPFPREELMVLPGFDGDTPLCPEGLDGQALEDWARASQTPGFPPSEAWPPRRAEPAAHSFLVEAQGKLERLEETIRRLESEKAVKDRMIAAQRVELLRLANELRAVKADLRLAQKSTRVQLEALMREERARQEGGTRDQLGQLLRGERAVHEAAVRRLAEEGATKDRWVASLMDDVERFKAELEEMKRRLPCPAEQARPAAPAEPAPPPPAPEPPPLEAIEEAPLPDILRISETQERPPDPPPAPEAPPDAPPPFTDLAGPGDEPPR